MDASELAILRKALEKRQRAHLWVPADAITFTPRVLPLVYGNGRALFALTTINQRPAYWIVRACSESEFGEFTDDILTALEEEFGNGRCGDSGNNLFQSRRDRMKDCKCEDCAATDVARWPMVDGSGGCAWGRMRWPKGFVTTPDGYYLTGASA
jgi:hypothetical protein